MDTRTKIVDAGQAARVAESGATVISGYFDPLTAEIAERLAQLKRPGLPLLVLIRSGDDQILPARARAELVAGLAVVDCVCEHQIPEVAAQISLEDEHQHALAKLIRYVHARQKVEA